MPRTLRISAQDFRKRSDKFAMDVMGATLGGMQNAQSKLEKTAERIAGASAPTADSVDLSTEMVGMLAARNQFQVNARVFQTADEMQKKLVDILA
jgi:flagellar hook protein FlgE